MRTTVDINCDLGEGCSNDAELMKHISSANIACGFHAGDVDAIRRTVDLAIENGVAIGAHPSYPDRENFGRTNMSLPVDQVFEIVSEQVLAIKTICVEKGARLHHVKPHGALYNQAANDRELAAAIAKAVQGVDKSLILFGLAGSRSIGEAQAAGLRTASEAFADRTYQTDGSLTPRLQTNALINSEEAAIAHVLQMIELETVTATDGRLVPIACDTVCIHGDGENAVSFARSIRAELERRDITIQPPK
jgi:5-oxoprolinase (ATP-hydrolysing) subunit A